MSVHLVGVHGSVSVRVSPMVRFRGKRWVRAEIDDRGDGAVDDRRFARARVDCQLGAEPRPGSFCLACPRLISWREGIEPRQLSVCCAWTHFDPVAARMTLLRAVVTVEPDLPCRAALRLALDESVHRLLVCRGAELVGVASQRDLAAGEAATPVAEVMSREVYVIDAGALLGEAASAFAALNIGCLPVVRDGRLVGVITRGDLRRAGLAEERDG